MISVINRSFQAGMKSYDSRMLSYLGDKEISDYDLCFSQTGDFCDRWVPCKCSKKRWSADVTSAKISFITDHASWHVIITFPCPAFSMIMKSNLCSGITIGLWNKIIGLSGLVEPIIFAEIYTLDWIRCPWRISYMSLGLLKWDLLI